MLTYVNAYNCVVAGNKSEVIITFFQNSPIHGEDGALQKMEQEAVATIAMTGAMATSLYHSLEGLLKNGPDETDNPE